jgi:molybdenum cofactor cytidylyltransferase
MTINACSHISSIILSAGFSSRMKTCKQLLPWGKTTVLGSIIQALQSSDISQIVVVSGGFREQVEAEADKFNVETAFNAEFKNGAMLDSVKTGLNRIAADAEGVFISLGDQPEITSEDIKGMCEQFSNTPTNIIVPSYEKRRGHPWLLPQKFFGKLMEYRSSGTLKDFLNENEAEISYYLVKSSKILVDLDTSEQYERLKPK